MANPALIEFLDRNRIRYSVTRHSAAFTAQEVAQTAHIPGKQMAKTVILRVNDRLVMAVVPASYRVDLEQLARATGTKNVALAHEAEFASTFPGCDVGGVPPFGNLWKVPVYVSDTLAEDETISFNAGNHYEIVTMAFSDYRRLVEPRIFPFSKHV